MEKTTTMSQVIDITIVITPSVISPTVKETLEYTVKTTTMSQVTDIMI